MWSFPAYNYRNFDYDILKSDFSWTHPGQKPPNPKEIKYCQPDSANKKMQKIYP